MMIKKVIAMFLSLFNKNELAAKILGVRIGENCKFIGNPIATFGSEPWAISIGDHVEITNGVQIITHDGALWTIRNRKEFLKSDLIKPVEIGNNVFIGVNSVILCGVTIGDNVIIGAGSIVNKNIPSNSVAVGVPAKVIESLEDYASKISEQGGLKETKCVPHGKKRKIWEDDLKNEIT